MHPASEQAGRVWCEVCTAEEGGISLQRDTVTVGVNGRSVVCTITCCHPVSLELTVVSRERTLYSWSMLSLTLHLTLESPRMLILN